MGTIILTVFFTIGQALIPVPGQAAQNPSSNPNSNKHYTDKTKPQPASGDVNKSQYRNNTSEAKTDSSEDSHIPLTVRPVSVNKNGWDYIYIIASLIIAVATLVLARIAWIQANASKAQIEAVIASNRPWLLIEWDKERFGDRIQQPWLVPVTEDPSENAKLTHCIFFIRNYGKTPAKVILQTAGLQVGDSVVYPPDTSVYDLDAPTSGHTSYMFPQQESIPFEARLFRGGFITSEDRDAVRSGSKFLWICGAIRYRDSQRSDTDPTLHETRFCYLWETRMNTQAPFWRMFGPPEYNRAT